MVKNEVDEVIRKLSEGREFRRIDVQNLELRAGENNEMVVEGYATKFNTIYRLYDGRYYAVDEQIDSSAFDEADMSDVIMQYDHQGRVFARNRNNTLEVTPDATGLHIRAYLGGTELGRQLYEEIKGGYTDRMSFGFTVAEDKREETEDHENDKITVLRTITKIKKLYDVSAVSIPANDATEISARSYCDGVIEELRKEFAAADAIKAQKQKIRLLCEI